MLGLGINLGLGARSGGGAAATLLSLTDRIVFAGNSYGAQTGNINIAQRAMMAAGFRPANSIGIVQARGGDRLTHLLDRIAPVKAVRPGLVVIMNPINDTNDAATSDNTTAAGDLILARFDAVVAEIRSVSPNCRIIAEVVGSGVTTYISKPISMARYEAGIDARAAADPLIKKFSPNGIVDFTNPAHSTDQVHPNTRVSAKLYGEALGALIASFYVTTDIFAGGTTFANSLIPAFNPATAWSVTQNSSGLSVAQSAGALESRPSITGRVLAVTGTSAQDPTSGGTTADLRIRYTVSLPNGYSSDGKVLVPYLLLEVTNSTGGAPVGLATLQINGNAGQGFNKQHVATDGSFWTEKYAGPMSFVVPTNGILNGQTTQFNFDLTVRGQQGVATDAVFRVAALNLIDTEAVAYGPAACMSRAFTVGDGTNRTVLRAIPTTTPATTVATGGTIAKSASGYFVGGGLTHTFDALRAGTTDVGDMVPALNGSAAVPYTTVAGDTGQGIAMRHSAANGMGSDSVLSNLVTVT